MTCNSAHEQTPLSNDTIDSVLRHREVGRAKDLSAPSCNIQKKNIFLQSGIEFRITSHSSSRFRDVSARWQQYAVSSKHESQAGAAIHKHRWAWEVPLLRSRRQPFAVRDSLLSWAQRRDASRGAATIDGSHRGVHMFSFSFYSYPLTDILPSYFQRNGKCSTKSADHTQVFYYRLFALVHI